MTKYKQTLAPAQPEPRRCWAEMSHRPSGFQLCNGSLRRLKYWSFSCHGHRHHHRDLEGEAALPQDHQRAAQLRCQVFLNNT